MLTKIILPIALVTLASSAFAAQRIRCAPESNIAPEGKTLEDYQEFFKLNKIVPKTGVSVKNVEQFKNEFVKFPAFLQRELVRAGNKIHIMEGEGVTVDPTWEPTHEKTFDGRPWSEVPGGGGSTARGYRKAPTRIVINSLYQKHGSANMFLHEHAHSLDSISSIHGISNSVVWSQILENEPGITKFLQEICGNYCTENVEEGFAELFANYHGCSESREQMEREVPYVSKFFRRFQSVKNLTSLMDNIEYLEKETMEAPPIKMDEPVEDRVMRVLRHYNPKSE